jgi:hypothetical protein
MMDDAASSIPNPDQLLTWEVAPPEPNFFADAGKDPKKSLLLFHIKTGHSYLPSLCNGVLPHSSQYPDIMAETWPNDTNLPEEVLNLHREILNFQVTQKTIEDSVAQFQNRIRLDGLLPACASCGIRYCFVSESDLDESAPPARMSARNQSAQSRNAATDTFALRPQPGPFIRLGLHNPLFETLHLTNEQKKERDDNKDYRHIYSVYDDIRNDVLKAVLHLQPSLMEKDPAGGEPKAIVCHQCFTYTRKNKRLSEQTKPRTKDTEHNERRAISVTHAVTCRRERLWEPGRVS